MDRSWWSREHRNGVRIFSRSSLKFLMGWDQWLQGKTRQRGLEDLTPQSRPSLFPISKDTHGTDKPHATQTHSYLSLTNTGSNPFPMVSNSTRQPAGLWQDLPHLLPHAFSSCSPCTRDRPFCFHFLSVDMPLLVFTWNHTLCIYLPI